VAVAEQRNFTRAAVQLGIKASALSQSIRSLEEELGVRLLNRTTRSVAPTEAGERMLAHLRPVLDRLSDECRGGLNQTALGTRSVRRGLSLHE
jgi:DNA-binding transcriptional LysR family regulator